MKGTGNMHKVLQKLQYLENAILFHYELL